MAALTSLTGIWLMDEAAWASREARLSARCSMTLFVALEAGEREKDVRRFLDISCQFACSVKEGRGTGDWWESYPGAMLMVILKK